MLYFLTAINDPCQNSKHLEYYHTYIGFKSALRECPYTMDYCRCCLDCYWECQNDYSLEYGDDD